MIYFGGLTFYAEDPKHFLKIPNAIATRRILNHFHRPHPEFKVIRSNGKSGRVDLVIPLRKHLIVTEWKVAQIDYLDIPVAEGRTLSREKKALSLSEYTLSQVLQLKFGAWDKFHKGQTIKQWMEGEVASQLRGYVKSPQVLELVKGENVSMRAHMILIVGSRHVLVWDVDCSGDIIGTPDLIGKNRG